VAESGPFNDCESPRQMVRITRTSLFYRLVPITLFTRYPIFIDAIIQSNGDGFIGTDRSTMSLLARRRVESWRNGVTRTVKWGTPNADDH
jgi:hypothetical protein